MDYPYHEVEAAIIRMRDAFIEAQNRNSWIWLADEFYHEDCVYECPFGGAMVIRAEGIDAIRTNHFGRDMGVGATWKGWSFPIVSWAINGNIIISEWRNRGPGTRPDGSLYETRGISIITYGGQGKFSHQYDLFDIAHQMRLCDELDAAGLLSRELKRDWVLPMKQRIVTMLLGWSGT